LQNLRGQVDQLTSRVSALEHQVPSLENHPSSSPDIPRSLKMNRDETRVSQKNKNTRYVHEPSPRSPAKAESSHQSPMTESDRGTSESPAMQGMPALNLSSSPRDVKVRRATADMRRAPKSARVAMPIPSPKSQNKLRRGSVEASKPGKEKSKRKSGDKDNFISRTPVKPYLGNMKIEVGHRYLLKDDRYGICKYFDGNNTLGLELEVGFGDSDGTIKGKKVFECENGKGAVVKVKQIAMDCGTP